MRMRMVSGGVGMILGMSLSLVATSAHAQQAMPPRPAPSAPAGAPSVPSAAPTDSTPLAVPTDLVRVQPAGLTSAQVGTRAAATSWNAKASMETLRGAAARVDGAWAAFLPRLSGLAKGTRLSEFTVPAIHVGNQTFSFPMVLNNWLLQATLTVPISD